MLVYDTYFPFPLHEIIEYQSKGIKCKFGLWSVLVLWFIFITKYLLIKILKKIKIKARPFLVPPEKRM